MFIGFLLAFQGIILLGMNELETTIYAFSNVQIVVLSVLAFPILDTTRVFAVRLKQGRSPFIADRNHIHHKLLNLGFSHIKATLLIIYVNVIVITSAVFVDYLDFNIHIQLLIVFTLAPLVYLSPFLVGENKKIVRRRTPKLLSKKMTSILPD
ncbi:hypothetical protein N7U66_13415 [Lacinutrix neustonica]|uniref:Uncharacterized protein n=1 Tax=Lacinutrix neustonica TaxID=2980107 RepID=A0A9E8MUF4_9FLAO|nr:hypothetical protein [Lacinutrix neustonica]WAC01149.1 hypothetical protein N7U66_13415 [Lacinutrix neustonica]